MLMNHADFIVESVFWGLDDNLVAVDKNVTLIGEIYTRNHIHQGGFTASVFAEKRQYFTAVHRQVDIAVGHDAAESFGYAAKLYCNIAHKISPF